MSLFGGKCKHYGRAHCYWCHSEDVKPLPHAPAQRPDTWFDKKDIDKMINDCGLIASHNHPVPFLRCKKCHADTPFGR